MPTEMDGVIQYSVDELKGLLTTGTARVIDVRTDEEYEEGHIPGIPLRTMQTLLDWVGELDRDESYVFVCRSGSRSQRVASYLKEQGFSHVANYAGGMMAWNGEVKSGTAP
jgi:rhodanese-related sulfurtransferase